MAGYIGTQAVSVNTTSATIADDLAVGDDATITGDVTIGGTALVTGVLTTTAAAVFNTGFVSNNQIEIKGTTPTVFIGDAGAEDAKIVFDGNAQDFHIGLDDSSDSLVLGLGAALGTTSFLSLTSTGLADFVSSIDGFGARITNNNDGSEGLQIRTSDNDAGEFILDCQTSSSATGTDYASKFVLTKGGNVGIGNVAPDGPLHVANGSAGSVTAFSGSVLTLETNGNNNFLSFLSPNAKNQGILFGDEASNFRGQIQYNHNGNTMAFFQDAITHFQIASTGLSDLFSTTTALRLRTGGTGTSTQLLSGAQGASNITNGAERIVIFANGNIQNTGGSYGSLSDEKLKENIVDATGKLDEIKKVKIRNFNFIGSSEKLIGVVAQEIETIFPALVDTVKDLDADGNQLETETKSVKSSIFIPILIKAMQEQQTLIEALTDRITALEA